MAKCISYHNLPWCIAVACEKPERSFTVIFDDAFIQCERWQVTLADHRNFAVGYTVVVGDDDRCVHKIDFYLIQVLERKGRASCYSCNQYSTVGYASYLVAHL